MMTDPYRRSRTAGGHTRFVCLSVVCVLAVCFAGAGCSSLHVEHCSDGTPVTLVRNVEDVYPVYCFMYDVGGRGTMVALERVLRNETVDADMEKQIVDFREDLYQERARFETTVESAFRGLEHAPCAASNREQFWTVLKEIQLRTEQLAQIENMLVMERVHELDFQSGLPQTGAVRGELMDLLRDYSDSSKN